jgi:hypothetical protein
MDQAMPAIPKISPLKMTSNRLNEYAGAYSNPVYETMRISVKNEHLYMVIGPAKVQIELIPVKPDQFVMDMKDLGIYQPFPAGINRNTHGTITGITLVGLNYDGCGGFKKVSLKTEAALR